MAKPTEGKVILPNTPADVSDLSIEEACKAIQAAGNVPRRLTVGNDDVAFFGQPELADQARKHGLVLSLDGDFGNGEWTVDDMGQHTYWNEGI